MVVLHWQPLCLVVPPSPNTLCKAACVTPLPSESDIPTPTLASDHTQGVRDGVQSRNRPTPQDYFTLGTGRHTSLAL